VARTKAGNYFKGIRQALKKCVESVGREMCSRKRKTVQGNDQLMVKDINTKQWQLSSSDGSQSQTRPCGRWRHRRRRRPVRDKANNLGGQGISLKFEPPRATIEQKYDATSSPIAQSQDGKVYQSFQSPCSLLAFGVVSPSQGLFADCSDLAFPIVLPEIRRLAIPFRNDGRSSRGATCNGLPRAS
jgi:hypothetical protein